MKIVSRLCTNNHMYFDFISPKGIEITPSDRKKKGEQEKEDKRA